jgi:NAD(P)-dependent dehydrogenase (short-subunit alcohol dehydrogenase family)
MQKIFTLITGASSGIGAGIARSLAAQRNLIVSGRDEARLEEVRCECERAESHLVFPCDLKDVAAIEARLVGFLARHDCGVDGFIHSAGIAKILPVRMVDHAAALDVMNTNFLSALEVVRLLVKKKVNQTNLKTVTFISSAASKLGERGNSIYAASKGAIDSLAKSLAVELAPNVRVNAVLPGMVRTNMSSSTLEDREHAPEILKMYPLGFGEVADVAALVRFLVSDEARWITGQHLIVDGGRTCI